MSEPARGYTVIGAGKTAMDACSWLLDNGVEPDAIRWIRPRDAWMLDRAHAQPLDLVTAIIEDVAAQLEAAAEADSVGDLFARLEANGHLIRLDKRVEPTMYRCATVSTSELEQLRSIENVVRQGRVRAIGTDEIVLEAGTIPTDVAQVHVDCTAAGLRVSPDAPSLRTIESRCSKCASVSPRSTPRWSDTWKRRIATMPNGTACARPTRIRLRRATGSSARTSRCPRRRHGTTTPT